MLGGSTAVGFRSGVPLMQSRALSRAPKFRPQLIFRPIQEILLVIRRMAIPQLIRGPGCIDGLFGERSRSNWQTKVGQELRGGISCMTYHCIAFNGQNAIFVF